MNPYQVVKDFESALCDYTGAKYAVTTTSCTMALLLACAYFRQEEDPYENDWTITIPSKTYVGVPMSIIHAGYQPRFVDIEWVGSYELQPLPIIDSARWFTSGMVKDDLHMYCVSFHPTKHLGLSTHGGAILHGDGAADEWLRKARFDGRQEGVAPRSQKGWALGWHAYINPVTAAEGLSRLAVLPKHNEPLPNDQYPDLSKLEIFS